MTESSFAEIFERILVPSTFRPWGKEFLDRVKPRPNERVLDVACGTGIVARLVRERCGPATRIAGVDINLEMVAIARSVAPDIEWIEGNALKLPFQTGTFDLVLCQQALQFFPDRAAAVGEMRRVLTEGGRVALSTWRPIAENPLFTKLHGLAVARFGPHEDRRFSFGDPNRVSELLTQAGFCDVRSEAVTLDERTADARMFVEMNLDATVRALDGMGAAEREDAIQRFLAEAAEVLAPFTDGAGLVHPVSANVITARAYVFGDR
jgi:ubiquinone/menaquinone biosynthesis C-methylase UbiE